MPSDFGAVRAGDARIGDAKELRWAAAAVTRLRTRYLVLAGVVRPAPEHCEWADCTATKIEVHHPDNDDPTLVLYYCGLHHRAADRALRA